MPHPAGRAVWVLAASITLTGCIVPRYALIRPAMDFVVLDAAGEPVEDAIVTVVSASNPHRVLHSAETRCSDRSGRAGFSSRREWEVVAPVMIHGVPFYYAAWCIEAPGFALAAGEDRTPEWGGRVHVHLASSPDARSCEELLGQAHVLGVDEEGEGRRLTGACR